MRPRRFYNQSKISQNASEQEAQQLLDRFRPHSTRDLYKQIRGLKLGLKRLQISTEDKLTSLQHIVDDKSLRKTKKTQATNSDSSEAYKQANYKVTKEANRLRHMDYGTSSMDLPLRKRLSQKKINLPVDGFWPASKKHQTGRRLNNNVEPELVQSSDPQDQISSSNQSLSRYRSKYRYNFTSAEEKLNWIRENVIGLSTTYISPLEVELQAIYADHTATNRPFKMIETMVDHAKLYTANPHTEYSEFGHFSTDMVHYAQSSLLKSFSADEKDYIAVPAGSGATGAMRHTIQLLQNTHYFGSNVPTIFISPYQHHSNILPWAQFYGTTQVLVNDDNHSLILPLVREQLIRHSATDLIISVSAASNLTSKLTDLPELNSIVKQLRRDSKKKVIFALDCAAYCCHHELNLKELDEVDFVFISPHKNLGGAQTCGVLVLKKSFVGSKPTFPGGGTVKFVKGHTKKDIEYQGDPSSRQMAGTPPFFGFYRAALSFQLLKQSIGYKFIHELQQKNTKLFFKLISQANGLLKKSGVDSEIKIYGQTNLEKRANVVSLNIINREAKTVYHHLLGSALSDIFGVQVRSGCFCAGPYGIQLMDLTVEDLKRIQGEIKGGNNLHKPGFVRLDLTFYLKQYEVKYLVKCIFYLAKYHKNIELLYITQPSGHVEFKNSMKKSKRHLLGLVDYVKARKKLNGHNRGEAERLRGRRATLEAQLRLGKGVCQHPEDYMF